MTWNALCYRIDRKDSVPEPLVSGTASDLRTAYALRPEHEYLVYIGKCYVVVGRPLEGLPELERAVETIPRGEPGRAFALSWRGNAKLVAGDEAGATDDWLAALASGRRELATQALPYAAKVKDELRRRQLANAGFELKK